MIKLLKSVVKRNSILAKVSRSVIDSQFKWQTPMKTGHGFLMVGNRNMMEGKFEIEETQLVQKLLDRSEVFINIGANIGYYCLMALNKGKHTVAVEPMPRNVECLIRNVTLNGWQNDIELLPMALGESCGLIKIYGGGTVASLVKGWSDTPDKYFHWTPLSTVDKLFGSRFATEKCLVLVDVEGAELHLLRGALQFMAKAIKPIWMVEICIDEHLPDGLAINPNLLETFDLFWNSGYKSFIADHLLNAVRREDILSIIKNNKNTLNNHNFIFCDEQAAKGLANM